MNLFSCLNGRAYIFLVLITATCNGCSVPLLDDNDFKGTVPPSNIYVAETVIERAFNDLGIHGGRGMEVFYLVDGSGEINELVKVIAPEFLISQGFCISKKNDAIPEIRFSVDTLYINLMVERTKNTGKQISRSAEARIGAVLVEKNGIRKVFTGRGVFHDFFAVSMLDAVGIGEPYVIRSNRFIDIFKPILFGLAITAFAWFLYSYRG